MRYSKTHQSTYFGNEQNSIADYEIRRLQGLLYLVRNFDQAKCFEIPTADCGILLNYFCKSLHLVFPATHVVVSVLIY